MAETMAMPKVWTVSELTAAVKSTLEGGFRCIDLEGEVSGFKRYPSGHVYFTLKDAFSQISAVMFNSVFEKSKLGDAFKDGVRLKVRGQVTVGTRSQYQIIVRLAKTVGEGELMQRYIELKKRLEAEGLFDQSKKRPLPSLPRRIGVVTSEAGAVVHDICRVLMRHFPALEIRIFPAKVQGVGAAESIIAGINYFNECEWRADVIIFGRGGGSFEDLFCFNDEALVRTVAGSTIPTISAVGHETDFTLCDFAADRRAGTPSMAAEMAVPVMFELKTRIATAASSLRSSLRGKYEWYAQRMDALSEMLGTRLNMAADRSRHRLESLSNRLHPPLKLSCEKAAHRVAALSERLGAAVKIGLERADKRLVGLSAKVTLLSPYGVLERGYSITTDEHGAVVRSPSQVQSGAKICTRLKDGELHSVVA